MQLPVIGVLNRVIAAKPVKSKDAASSQRQVNTLRVHAFVEVMRITGFMWTEYCIRKKVLIWYRCHFLGRPSTVVKSKAFVKQFLKKVGSRRSISGVVLVAV